MVKTDVSIPVTKRLASGKAVEPVKLRTTDRVLLDDITAAEHLPAVKFVTDCRLDKGIDKAKLLKLGSNLRQFWLGTRTEKLKALPPDLHDLVLAAVHQANWFKIAIATHVLLKEADEKAQPTA